MDDAEQILPPGRRWLVTIVVLGGVFMVVLDSTIANVALPHMQAALGATQDSVSWVLTSYIIASAIATPITGWLANRFGTRALFTLATIGFTLSSALCAASASLPMMIVARLLQGMFGAFLVPLSQSVMFAINPPAKHAQAMTIWSMGIMVAPLLGPLLGGWLTETWNWRWVFLINAPVGAATAVASWLLLPNSPKIPRRFDLFGFAVLAVLLMSLQLALDRGTERDWFDSREIVAEVCIAVAALWIFAVHSATAREPIVPLALFKEPTYVAGLVLITMIGGILTGGSALITPMLQRLLNYPVFDAGLLVVPRGIGVIIGMLAAGRLIQRIDSRIVIFTGMTLTALSLRMMTGFDLGMDARPVVISGVIQGIGLGCINMPLSLLAVATLPAKIRTEGTALYNLMRNIGASVGISITTAELAANLQVNHADISSTMNPELIQTLRLGVLEHMGVQSGAAFQFLDGVINQQGLMISYLDDYLLMMWAVVVTMPLVLILRPRKPDAGAAPAMDAGH